MTDQSGLPLSAFLPNDLQLDQTVKGAISNAPGTGAMRLAWDVIGSQAVDALRNVLNVDVFEIVGGAWAELKNLREYSDPLKHPKGERSVVFLGEHSFSKSVDAVLDVEIGTLPALPLRFTVVLAVNVRAVALTICDGCITSIGKGDGDVSAELDYGRIELVPKTESKKVQLPLHYDFKAPGLVIG